MPSPTVNLVVAEMSSYSSLVAASQHYGWQGEIMVSIEGNTGSYENLHEIDIEM